MFSSRQRLDQRTPKNGIDRKEFIHLLVDEYYETTNCEAQEQVTANLANFAYDPLNYAFLRESKAVELFLQLLHSSNPKLVLHGIAALCNICLDPECSQLILSENGIEEISSLLDHSSPQVIENCIATLVQLDSPETHPPIFSATNRSKVEKHQNSSNPVLRNWAQVYLEIVKNVNMQSSSSHSSAQTSTAPSECDPNLQSHHQRDPKAC